MKKSKKKEKKIIDEKRTDSPILNDILNNIGDSEFHSFLQEGTNLFSLGRSDEALEAFHNAININSDIPSPWFNMGNIYFERNNYGEAIRCYSRAIDLNKDYIPALQNRSIAFNKLKDQGANTSEEAIQQSLVEAERLIYEGEFENVLDLCEILLKKKPDSSLTWFWKGKALSALARDEEALHCYILSNNLQSWITSYTNSIRTKFYFMSKDSKTKDRIMERKPEHSGFFPSAQSWSSQGAYTQTLGKFEEALYCYKKALEIESNHKAALRNRKRVIRLLKEEELYDPKKELKKSKKI